MDWRQWLEVKQFEFLLHWFMQRQRELKLAELNEPLAYDGFSLYDQLCQQMLKEAEIAYLERFSQPVVPIALTNILHLAELELAGRPPRRPTQTVH
ncbi:hypothetical protein J2X32_002439 [Rheinheimera pacifica]|uniref:hypothetical protein n=1 Tax=Rheinheimera pacifica TaxID=173990 RepID=UPI000CC740C5|nr:hypothetical protein [Rheinheimera pacifica]MDR6983803.1 hypothetical protein [Rheinheimera pacifica]PKM19884.1 MAG: hypothetical protein CVV11_09810 [Gammaproteobacteria bacterium HGW-Gammaproteobacteria-15]